MRICSLFLMVVGLAASSRLSAGTASWEAIISDPSGFARPLAVPSDVLVGSPISTESGDSAGVAITPDGSKALIAGTTDVCVLDLTQPIITVTTVGGFTHAKNIAITPDGTRAFVTDYDSNAVAVLNLTSSPFSIESWVSVGYGPLGVAITPDGTQALVTLDDDSYHIVDVLGIGATVQFLYHVDNPDGYSHPYDIAITPDGTKALMTENGWPGFLVVFEWTQYPIAIDNTLTVGTNPTGTGVAITPDGTLGLVSIQGNPAIMGVVNLTRTPISFYFVTGNIGDGIEYYDIAITPDGTRAYVAAASESNFVEIFDLTKTPVEYVGRVIVYLSSTGIAITPDQAPTSIFITSVDGLTVFCDGSGSSSPVGNIREYQWDFGDGTTVTTTSPTVSHTYGESGIHTIVLTVVNDAGTSLETTFTGKTISNRGLPRARSEQSISLDPQAPRSFNGKAFLNKERREVILKLWWPASKDKATVRYEILARGLKLVDVPSTIHNSTTLRLHPRHFPEWISPSYKLYLHNKYSIRSVNTEGSISSITQLEME